MTSADKVYKIEEDSICGRQLVAKRKIHAGEVIIDEPALLAGPGFARGNAGSQERWGRTIRNDDDRPSKGAVLEVSLNDFVQEDAEVCLVCCVNLNPSKSTQCQSCELFLCSEHCKSHVLHTQNECLIFSTIRQTWHAKKNRSKKSLYNLVLVTRGLFYKFRDPTKWAQIQNLDSKSRGLQEAGGFLELQDVFNSLTWDMFASLPGSTSAKTEIKKNDNDEMTIQSESILEAAQHCLGVMRINAFSSFSESYSRECLFFISSFMAHSCVINTDRQIGVGSSGDVRMVVRASVDIEKGHPITTTYLSLLYSTEQRCRIMISSWLFICKCKRCMDPFECQTYSGAITCRRKFLQTGSLVICDNTDCQCHVEKEAAIKTITEACPRDLYDISKVEAWLDTHDTGHIIHSNHSIFAHVKLFLCQFYGRQRGGFNALSISQVKRKVIYCLQILNLYDRVCPGFQMCRGVVMFELWCGLRKLLEAKKLPLSISYLTMPENVASAPQPQSSSNLILTTKDINEIKTRALEILRYALPNSPEAAMQKILVEED